MRRIHLVQLLAAALLAATACGKSSGSTTGTSGSTGDSGSSGTGGTSASACAGTHFDSSAASFALPDLVGTTDRNPLHVFDSNFDCSSGGTGEHYVTDLDGDGLPDLVLTEDCQDALVGASYWLVYKGTGSGFASSANQFALPDLVGSDAPKPFDRLSASASCSAGGSAQYWLTDLDGDGKPDLVLTTDCQDAMVGASYWLVYKNTGSGFASSSSQFALPDLVGASAVPLQQLGGIANCAGGGSAYYALADLDGDHKPELVLATDCSDAQVGASYWDVYANSGSGFASSPSHLGLPDLVGSSAIHPFDRLSTSTPCSNGDAARYSLTDLDGDGKPDLVFTAACNDNFVGASYWLVYQGSGSSFADTPAQFALPDVVGASDARPISDITSETACSNGDQAWYSLLDLDGDGKPDLVFTSDCSDALVGASYWRVYKGSGSGFASSASQFALPDLVGSSGTRPLGQLGSRVSCSNGDVAEYALTDLDGDHRPDLVVTTDCQDALVGASYWNVFKNSCSP